MTDLTKRDDQALNSAPGFLNGRFWTDEEVAILRELAAEGAGIEAIARKLGRTLSAVRAKASDCRVSLRQRNPDGSLVRTSGRLLGQPQSGSWASTENPSIAEYRRRVLAGEVDPAELERALREERRRAKRHQVCVRCGRNYVISTATGLCAPCFSSKVDRIGTEGPEKRAVLVARLKHRQHYHERVAADLRSQIAQLGAPE